MPKRRRFDREEFDRIEAKVLRWRKSERWDDFVDWMDSVAPNSTLKEYGDLRKMLDEVIKRMDVLQKTDPEAFEVINRLTPGDIWKVRRLLPRPRGRTLGKGKVVDDDELLDQLRKAVDDGEVRTTAARRLLQERGEKGNLKGKAGHLLGLLDAKAVPQGANIQRALARLEALARFDGNSRKK